MPKPINPVYGWVKQPEDPRDLRYALAKPEMVFEPAKSLSDLRHRPAFDQGQIGSCTGHGIVGDYLCIEKKDGITEWVPSRLGLYYDERSREGTISQDAGAIIRDGIKVFNQIGVGPEELWPYDISKFTETPPAEYYAAAQKNRIRYYASVDNSNINNLKLCIHHGSPFIFGMEVYTKFERYTGGVLQYPGSDESYLGGHCIFGYAYDDSDQSFECQNSWGEDWGINGGSFKISYQYITSRLCSDFWVIAHAG
jgi:C1A family cysteine protease